jgi:hypothetical protein
MMLRVAVLLLAVANALFFAWSSGWLDGIGLTSRGEREPERLQRQVRPDAVRVLPATVAGATPAGEPRSNP